MNDFLRIGIFTFWWTEDNYGQVLQMYGLSKFLERGGHKVEIVRYKPSGFSSFTFKKKIIWIFSLFKKKTFLVSIISYIYRKRYSINQGFHPRGFFSFRSKYFTFSGDKYDSICDLNISPPFYDVYICGSDQVWNYFPSGKDGYPIIDVYSFAFGDSSVLRLSYAASMGFSGINRLHGKRLANNLHNFEGVSVREKDGVNLLKEYGISNVVWVPDPTMLLGAEEYSSLISNDDQFHVPFFIYGLLNKSVLTSRHIALELQRQQKRFQYVGGNGLIDNEITAYPTVEEWLSYMYGAETIITNSFHGCVFSILFQKNFYYYPLLPNNEGHVDTRIDSLLDRLGIEGRAIRTKEELSEMINNPCKPIDWESVKIKQDEFVQVGKDFLAKHLKEAAK